MAQMALNLYQIPLPNLYWSSTEPLPNLYQTPTEPPTKLRTAPNGSEWTKQNFGTMCYHAANRDYILMIKPAG